VMAASQRRHRHPQLLVRHPAHPAVRGEAAVGRAPGAFRAWTEDDGGGLWEGLQALLLPAVALALGAGGDPGARDALGGAGGACARTSCAPRAPRA
jgi:hypothetical protein